MFNNSRQISTTVMLRPNSQAIPMSKTIRQANPPIDESISKCKDSYDAPPTTSHNLSATAAAARARITFADAFHAIGQDRIRYSLLSLLKLKVTLKLNKDFSPVYFSIIAQGLAYLFCKVGGGLKCSGLSLCIMTFVSTVHFAARTYAESRDDTKQQIGRLFFFQLSLMLCSFCYFLVDYLGTKCSPS